MTSTIVRSIKGVRLMRCPHNTGLTLFTSDLSLCKNDVSSVISFLSKTQKESFNVKRRGEYRLVTETILTCLIVPRLSKRRCEIIINAIKGRDENKTASITNIAILEGRTSRKRTPLGPSIAVRLREVSSNRRG